MERWGAYDKDFRLLPGVTLLRGESIPAGVYHLVCDVLVRHTDGSYLVMQRDPRKHYGGMWEATAGGSAWQGETPARCAARELAEETGIAAQDLREVGRVSEGHTHYVEFLCRTDCAKDSIVLQEGETVAYRWVSARELSHMRRSELLTDRMQQFVKELNGAE